MTFVFLPVHAARAVFPESVCYYAVLLDSEGCQRLAEHLCRICPFVSPSHIRDYIYSLLLQVVPDGMVTVLVDDLGGKRGIPVEGGIRAYDSLITLELLHIRIGITKKICKLDVVLVFADGIV